MQRGSSPEFQTNESEHRFADDVVRGRILTRVPRLGQRAAARKEPVEDGDRVRDVVPAVIIRVRRIRARQAAITLEEEAEDRDGVGDVDKEHWRNEDGAR